MHHNPYDPPQQSPQHGYTAWPSTPPVWRWYLAYAITMAVLYLAVAGLGVFLSLNVGIYDPAEKPPPAGLITGVGVLLFLPFAAAPFLAKAPWAWVYHLVLICLGMTSACCLPVSIPLLIFWLRPETKAFFGRAA